MRLTERREEKKEPTGVIHRKQLNVSTEVLVSTPTERAWAVGGKVAVVISVGVVEPVIQQVCQVAPVRNVNYSRTEKAPLGFLHSVSKFGFLVFCTQVGALGEHLEDINTPRTWITGVRLHRSGFS